MLSEQVCSDTRARCGTFQENARLSSELRVMVGFQCVHTKHIDKVSICDRSKGHVHSLSTYKPEDSRHAL